MSENAFPSGPWVGFYNYAPGDRHRMDLQLRFVNGRVSGDGNDDVGRFLIQGSFDATQGECHWTKVYPGSHDVFYRGFREGKGIWGTWEIGKLAHGGFHIWPKGAQQADAEAASAEMAAPVDAISEYLPSAAPNTKLHARVSPRPATVAGPIARRAGRDAPLEGRGRFQE